MAVLTGTNADVYATSGVSVAFSDLALTDSGDHMTYTSSDATKRYWDDTVAMIVQTSPDGVTWTTVAVGFTTQHIGGKVIFTVANAVGTQVRISGSYIPVSQVAQANSWELALATKEADTTVFGDAWESSQLLLVGATVKVGRLWTDTVMFGYMGKRVVVVLYANEPGGTRWEGFANLKGETSKAAIAAVDTEDLEFTITGELYYSAS